MGRRQGLRAKVGLGAMALLAVAAVLAAAASANEPPTPVTVTFGEPGSHPFVVPAGVTSISVDAFGAEGGDNLEGPQGGLGAEALASTIAVTPGEALTVLVGGRGGDGIHGTTLPPETLCQGGLGGSNGGGGGGACTAFGSSSGPGGGGGASELRRGGAALVVAGGGGGAGGNLTGGIGGAGGESGTAGAIGSSGSGGGGGGGATPAAFGTGGALQGIGAVTSGGDGSAGQGGTGGESFGSPGGGGGGGVFGGGGGGGSQNFSGGGGGGGSSMGPAGTAFTTGADAANAGNGKVVITYTVRAATTTTLEATPNPSQLGAPVTLTATVAGAAPSGQVSFKDGTSTIETAALGANGKATLSISSLGAGSHAITAAYGGDAENLESASAPLTLVVEAPAPPPTPTPPAPPAPLPAVTVLYSPNAPHQPNPSGGPRYTFVFSDAAPGVSFYCRLDGQPFKPCGSPKAYRHLSRGRHVFRVKSVDAAGRESAVTKVEFFAGRRAASAA